MFVVLGFPKTANGTWLYHSLCILNILNIVDTLYEIPPHWKGKLQERGNCKHCECCRMSRPSNYDIKAWPHQIVPNEIELWAINHLSIHEKKHWYLNSLPISHTKRVGYNIHINTNHGHNWKGWGYRNLGIKVKTFNNIFSRSLRDWKWSVGGYACCCCCCCSFLQSSYLSLVMCHYRWHWYRVWG